MLPHHELNDRFRRRELHPRFIVFQQRERVTKLLGVSLLCVCMLVGVGFAFEGLVPADAIAQLSNIPSEARDQLAAASSLPWLDAFARNVYDAVCPYFTDCEAAHVTPVLQFARGPRITDFVTNQPPRKQTPASAIATSSVTLPENRSATPPPTTVITQPLIERIRETVRTVNEGGVNAAYVDARMSALSQSLLAQINAVAANASNQSTTIFQTLGAVARIENLNDVNITGSRWTGGSVEATSISGTIAAAINSAVGTILDLTTNTLTATNATTTNFVVTGSASLPTTTVTGDLSVSGTLTAGSLSVAGISSSGALIGPYVTAPSTLATSTFAGGFVVGTNKLLVDLSTGFVGIGTAKPELPLHIVSDGGAAYVMADSYRNSSFGGGTTIRHARGTVASPVALNSGDRAGTIFFAGYDGGAFNNTASILSAADGTPTANAGIPGRLVFSTTPANSVFEAERMRIDSNGNVGIGQTSPTYKLDVSGLGRFTGLVDAANFVATSTTATSTFAGGLAVETSGLVYDYSTNRVGIGTASPGAQLEVSAGGGVSDGAGTGATLKLTVGGNSLFADSDELSVTGSEFFIGNTAGSYKNLHLGNGFNILSGGNVGIASTSPSRHHLHVGGIDEEIDPRESGYANERCAHGQPVALRQ